MRPFHSGVIGWRSGARIEMNYIFLFQILIKILFIFRAVIRVGASDVKRQSQNTFFLNRYRRLAVAILGQTESSDPRKRINYRRSEEHTSELQSRQYLV